MNRESILVVDDDLVLLKKTELLLMSDYSVSIAKSGEQALNFLRNRAIPSLILLDINMPEMDGYEALKKIRQIPGCEKIPVIFLTGYEDSEHQIRGLDNGVNDYITKSCDKDVMLARIRMHLRRESGMDSKAGKPIPQEIRSRLTDTEIKVLEELLQGRGNREIAESLNYSYGYIKNITSLIFAKLEVRNRKELRRLIYEDSL